MEKRYKLIKSYPGSPEIGTVVSKTASNFSFINNIVYCYACNNFSAPINIVENNPEFWEEVVEKPLYEVLEYLGDDDILYRKIGESFDNPNHTFFYGKLKYATGKHLLKSGAKINRIKRLSDNEKFSVGEKIYYDDTNRTTNIYSFIIINDNQLVARTPVGGVALRYMRKYTNFLFKTEDGVDIYEGMSAVFVRNDFTVREGKPTRSEWGSKALARFSTMEKANKFIFENKPCLSFNDAMSIIKYREYHSFDETRDKAETITQSRL